MSKSDNQRTRIINHLNRYGSITQREAQDEYGIARLASRIEELRKGGYPIKTVRQTGVNRYGEAVSYAKYVYGG